MKIGFIGLGVMGSRMVKRFLSAGFEVQVYNRTAEKALPLIELGAHKAENIASLAEDTDVICSCLSMPEDSRNIYLENVLKYAIEGTICIDFATIDANTSKKIAQHALGKGIHYLDAPVSGGPEGVEKGTLSIMVGGDRKAFAKVKPLLQSIGQTVEFFGPSGSGSVAKLINQYLVAVHSIAASEAMVAGAANGLDSEQLYQLLKVSYGQSHILERHMEQYVLKRQFEPGGAVKYVHKDVRLANQLFYEAGMKGTLGELAESGFAYAEEKGLADQDMSAVIKPLEEKCGVIVKGK